jgi:pentatricopeptide repeat protein
MSGADGLALQIYSSMGLLTQDEKSKEKFFRLLCVSEVSQLLEALRQQSARTAEHDVQQHQHHIHRLELLLAHLWYRLEDLDKRTADCALEIYGRAGAVESAEWIFRRLLECGEQPQTDTFNKLMTVYLSRIKQQGFDQEEEISKCIKKIECIWEEVSSSTDGPDSYSYNILLSAKVRSGDIEGAEKVFEEMVIQPDRVSFHILLNGYLKALEYSHQQQAEVWLGKMIKHGIQPDTKTFNTLMAGLVSQMRRSGLGRGSSIGTLEATANTVLKLADAMEKLGVEKDTHSIGILLRCYYLCGDMDRVDKVARSLKVMMNETDSQEQDTATAKSYLVADKYIYNSLMNIYLSVGHDEKAMEIYHDMVCKGKQADAVTYGTLIRHSIKRGNTKGALGYYQMMQQAGIQPNMRIRKLFLSGDGGARPNNDATCTKAAGMEVPSFETSTDDGAHRTVEISERNSPQ